jgi:hypothetical protein
MENNFRSRSKAIFLLPALRTVFFITGGLLMLKIPAFRGMNLDEVSMWWPLLCIAVNLLTIAVLVFLTKRDGKNFRDLFNHKKDIKKTFKALMVVIPGMLLLGMGGLMGFSWLVYGYMPVTTIHPLPIWAAMVVALFLPLTIVFSEIPFYLGYCTPGIKGLTQNELISLVYPLFFYALQHSFMPLLFDFKHIFSRFIMFIPLLIMMGLWYSRKKDLIPLMTGHGILDILTGLQILMVSMYPSLYEIMLSSE